MRALLTSSCVRQRSMLVCEEYQAAESEWHYARSPSLATLPDDIYWPRARAGAHVARDAGMPKRALDHP